MSRRPVLILASGVMGPGGIQRYTRILQQVLGDIEGPEQVHGLFLRKEADGAEGRTVGWAQAVGYGLCALQEAWRGWPRVIVCAHVAFAPLTWLLAKLVTARYVVVTYGIEVWGRLPWWRLVALRQADRIVAISHWTKHQLLTRHQLQPERMVVLPGALGETFVHLGEAPDGGSAWSTLEGWPVVLSVGRLAAEEQYKGHELVIRALPEVVQRVPGVRYLIVGDGTDRARLERLAHEVGVADRVVFAGWVAEEALVAAYHRCDLLIMPSRTVTDGDHPQGEGLGYVFLEAMACGKPVIGPDRGAPTEFIKHGEHGLLVDPEDPQAIAEAMATLLTQPELARRMGDSARAWVLQHYSSERFREGWQAVLQDVMDEHPHR